MENKTEVGDNKMSVSSSAYASITLNEYALATELYNETIESSTTKTSDKSSTIYFELGIRTSLSFQ